MEFITWPIAVGFTGSIATLCLTVLKIYQMKRRTGESVPPSVIEAPLAEMQRRIAVQEVLLTDTRDDIERLEENLSKLNDAFIKILTDK